MNQQSKPWYLSKGFVGPLVSAILFSLRSLGIADIDTETALGILYQSAEFVGIIIGMAGRAMAEKKLTLGSAITPRQPDQASDHTAARLPGRTDAPDRPSGHPHYVPGEG